MVRRRLRELAPVIRSKNAGVDHVTFDVFFARPSIFEEVLRGDAFTAEGIAKLLQISPDRITNIEPVPEIHALKFTIRRSRPSGDPGEPDVYGAQYYAPLVDLEVEVGGEG